MLPPLFYQIIARKRAYACLMYHRVGLDMAGSPAVNPSTRVSTAKFIRHMTILRRYFTPLALPEILARLDRGETPDRFYVAVSFDDGYRDVLTQALPVLESLGIPFTVFLATGFMDSPSRIPWWDILERVARNSQDTIAIPRNGQAYLFDLTQTAAQRPFFRVGSQILKPHPEPDQELKRLLAPYLEAVGPGPNEFLRWDQVRTLAQSPLASLAPHTCWHPNLAVRPDRYEEISRSRERLREEVGAVPPIFSYPFGSAGRPEANGLEDYLKAQGFTAAFTGAPGHLSPQQPRYLLPRIPVSGRDPELFFWLKLWAPAVARQLYAGWRRWR